MARLVAAALIGTPLALHGQSKGGVVTYGASAGTIDTTGLYLAPADSGSATITVRGATATDTMRVSVVRAAPPPPTRGPLTPIARTRAPAPDAAVSRVATPEGPAPATTPPATTRPAPTRPAANQDSSPRPKDGLWLDEDFSRYTSIEQYRSNPFGWLVKGPKWFHQDKIALDRTQGYGGSPQSLRYDWPGGPGCHTDYAIVTSYKAPPVPELWIEAVHKFAPTFNTNTKSRGGMCQFGEYKFLLFWRPTGDRFDLINGHLGREWWSKNPETPKVGQPPDCAGPNRNCRIPALGSDMHWDGQWHVYRFHIRFNSAQGVADGQFQIWVDGKLVKNVNGIDMTESRTHKWSNRLKEIFLGSNSNSGTSQPTQTWWGRLRIYTSDPGW